MAVDIARVCGQFQVKPWANRPDLVTVRVYRVPDDTPALPFAHRFLLPDWDGMEFAYDPLEDPGITQPAIGFRPKRVRYDQGALPAGWRPPTGWIGTESQWLNGSVYPADQPLVWQGGFSTACRAVCAVPPGKACATGCDQCPLVSELWCVSGFTDFAGLQETVICKREGCYFSSECVPAAGCPTGTSPAWQVVLDQPFAGLTNAALPWRGADWNNCCPGRF